MCSRSRHCRALLAVLLALYAASLYRDRYKLRSFPAVARRFFPVGFDGEMPDMRGRTALVTGANSGLGLETARKLLVAGANVVMACRSVSRCEDAREDLLLDFEGESKAQSDAADSTPAGRLSTED